MQNLITVKENLEPDLKIAFISCNEHLKRPILQNITLLCVCGTPSPTNEKTEHFSKADLNPKSYIALIDV